MFFLFFFSVQKIMLLTTVVHKKSKFNSPPHFAAHSAGEGVLPEATEVGMKVDTMADSSAASAV